MKLIADSGSTKTIWCLIDDGNFKQRILTQGINPSIQEEGLIREIIEKELLQKISFDSIDEINFYGAGCREEVKYLIKDVLLEYFKETTSIEINDDLLGAARALFYGQEGIALILGTGSNSCLYDGVQVKEKIPSLGFILGDEGSGAQLGKKFINALFKGGVPLAIKQEFLNKTSLSLDDIIRKVYKEPMPNRFLASFSKFIYEHLDEPSLEALVEENFEEFFLKNVNKYNRRDLLLGAIGSIAYYFKDLFIKVAKNQGYKVNKILKDPIEGLLQREGI